MTKGIFQSKIVWAAALMLVFSIVGILTGKPVPADTADQIIGLDWSNVAPAILSTLIILFRVFASGTKLSGWFGMNALLPLFVFACLLPSCKKADVGGVDQPPVSANPSVTPAHDRTLVIELILGGYSDAVSSMQVDLGISSIPSGTRYDVYATAPQSSYSPEPTSAYQLIGQFGPGSLANKSVYPSVSTYNSVFSTPYAPDGYFVWFKVQEIDTSGNDDVLVESQTCGDEIQ